MDIENEVKKIAKDVKEASNIIAKADTNQKNMALTYIAQELVDNKEWLIKENKKDLEKGKESGLSLAMLDRLRIEEKLINQMSKGLYEIVALPDPVGEIVKMWKRPNGLLVGKMRIPLGVIGIIYESRPNVTIDASALCLKSGNGVILRGGSEAINSNIALIKLIAKGLEKAGLPPNAASLIPIVDREAVNVMLTLEEDIDLIIPRGGESLIRSVVEKSRIPVIKHYKGVCHIYVDEDADLDMAAEISLNAKVQRPGVCNAMETLLVHENVAKDFLPFVGRLLEKEGVELRGCDKTRKFLPHIKEAKEEDWYQEYLDLILSIKVVADINEAIEHIEKYGSSHTESIITKDYNKAITFLTRVNSSTVLVNASTRFSDGYQFGLGAEIGISTTKLHAFGPMGLADLTTTKFIVLGNGQIRI